MDIAAPTRDSWSKLNIWLHWLIVGLIVAQFFDHEWMVAMWRAARRGTEIDQGTVVGGWVHIVCGTLILVFAAIRLWDRFAHGRPPHPQEEPTWAYWLARVTHFLIYAILIAMPLVGLVAWFGGVHEAGEIHELMWTPLLVLIGVHVVGALAQHFWFKTDVLRRMLRPA